MTGAMMLPEFDHEVANTRRMLEALPEGELDFRPAEKSYTLLELAGHVANLPNWIPATVLQDELDFAEPFEQPNPQTKSDLLELFEAAVASGRPVLEGASAEELMKEWTLRSGDQIHFAMPKVGVLRSFVFNHLVHHRGQLVVYLRLLNQTVPGMYGPSADETM